MQYYFAPLEGLTGHIYRNAHHRHFPGVDRYYMPFIVPNESGTLKKKDREDLLPENNTGIRLVPQLLSNHAGETLKMIRVLVSEYGYREINLNLGCPMPAITRKHRGSGLLAYPQELEDYLEGVFEGLEKYCRTRIESGGEPHGSGVRVSVKTRLGMYSLEEADQLIRIYNLYPIHELIVHPRCGKDLYRGSADRDAFCKVLLSSRIPVIYNGDIYTSEDASEIRGLYIRAESAAGNQNRDSMAVMIGRGLLRDPSLVRQLRGGACMTMEEFRDFHDDLYTDLAGNLPRKKVLLGLMKGYWYYWRPLFREKNDTAEHAFSEVFRADTIAGYEQAVQSVLSGMSF